LHVQVSRVPAACLLTDAPVGEPSRAIRERVCNARARQLARQGCPNSQLPVSALVSTCLSGECQKKAVEQAANQLQLSARSVHRLLRVALTISDLAGQEGVGEDHIGEALGYRGTA
ncbi:MAG: ATP-dependent protease, partial [Halioglobus sp.]|nr:ATP-dependent protease [Halioglobus sp.]